VYQAANVPLVRILFLVGRSLPWGSLVDSGFAETRTPSFSFPANRCECDANSLDSGLVPFLLRDGSCHQIGWWEPVRVGNPHTPLFSFQLRKPWLHGRMHLVRRFVEPLAQPSSNDRTMMLESPKYHRPSYRGERRAGALDARKGREHDMRAPSSSDAAGLAQRTTVQDD